MSSFRCGLHPSDLESAFGAVRKKFPGYEERAEQLAMAAEVFGCLREKRGLLVEAGTGVGKSFAYLIPAILSGEKTIVSTASIALQRQLVDKDLVFLRDSLPQKFDFALLKGKNNYVCLKREREFSEMSEPHKRFRQWLIETETGDRDELPFIPDFWARVCGDSDDCGGGACPFFGECFYYGHYRELHKKDIIVVNHHLLIYDLVSDFGLLPFHSQLVIDEAHQIENVISHVMGGTLSLSRVLWLLYRLRGLKVAVDHLVEPVEAFFKRPMSPQAPLAVHPIPEDVTEGLRALKGLLFLDKAAQRLRSYKETVEDPELTDKVETTIRCVRALSSELDDLIEQGDEDRVYYVTGNKGLLEVRSSLVEAKKNFDELVGGYGCVIMTSATMTAGGRFSFIKERLGIEGFREKIIGSPFDYGRQALLYIERGLPEPGRGKKEEFQQKGLEVIERLISASRGRALVLFTSYSHLDFAARNVKVDYPFRRQGEMPPAGLIRWFTKTPNSVLFATTTFWQGIDIKGEKLSLVVIAKMPFDAPGDPVYDERCRRLGTRWFGGLALPSAILMLRQGFGRLIRSAGDYGVVAILDARLMKSPYGRTVISSLPATNITHSIDDVRAFLAAHSPS